MLRGIFSLRIYFPYLYSGQYLCCSGQYFGFPDSIFHLRTVFFICGQYSLLTGKNLTKSKKNTAIPQNINGKRKLTTEYLYLSRLNHQMQGPFQQTQRLVNEILQRISAYRFIAIHHAVESGLFFCDRFTGEK